MLTLKVKPGQASDVIQALRGVMSAAQWNHGWMRAQAHASVSDSDVLHYLEEWLTADDTAREVRSARFGRLLELMETAAEPPDLQFQFINEVRGLDYVAEVRGERPPDAA